jgi:hypothetical protein
MTPSLSRTEWVKVDYKRQDGLHTKVIVVQNAQIGAKSIERCRVRWTRPSQNSLPGVAFTPQSISRAICWSENISRALNNSLKTYYCGAGWLKGIPWWAVAARKRMRSAELAIARFVGWMQAAICVSVVLGLPVAGRVYVRRSECARRRPRLPSLRNDSGAKFARKKRRDGPHARLYYILAKCSILVRTHCPAYMSRKTFNS